MKIIFVIYILIRVNYPSNDLESIRFFNQQIDVAMKSFCWLGVEYDLTIDKGKADLEIYPYFDHYLMPEYYGFTNSGIIFNPKVFGIPNIRISNIVDTADFVPILTHELCHYFGYRGRSIDEKSLMYYTFNGDNTTLLRHDSVFLRDLFNNLRENNNEHIKKQH